MTGRQPFTHVNKALFPFTSMQIGGGESLDNRLHNITRCFMSLKKPNTRRQHTGERPWDCRVATLLCASCPLWTAGLFARKLDGNSRSRAFDGLPVRRCCPLVSLVGALLGTQTGLSSVRESTGRFGRRGVRLDDGWRRFDVGLPARSTSGTLRGVDAPTLWLSDNTESCDDLSSSKTGSGTSSGIGNGLPDS